MRKIIINKIKNNSFKFTSEEMNFIKNCNKSNLFSQKAFDNLIYG